MFTEEPVATRAYFSEEVSVPKSIGTVGLLPEEVEETRPPQPALAAVEGKVMVLLKEPVPMAGNWSLNWLMSLPVPRPPEPETICQASVHPVLLDVRILQVTC